MMNKHTPEWYNSMYNNRDLVPEAGSHIEFWQTQSQKVLKETSTHRVQAYYGQGQFENLDIYPLPQVSKGANSPSAPVVVFIHGGYWRSLYKEDHAFVAPALNQIGACAVILNYDLCPQVTIEQITMQMVKAMAWVWAHIAEYGGDPSRIHVVGHSAGGHLSAMLLNTKWKKFSASLPKHLIKSGLSISGLHEMESIRKTPFLNVTLKLNEASAVKLSPAWMPKPKRGHLYSVVGGLESAEFIRQCLLIQKTWGKKAVPQAKIVDGLHHFSILESVLKPDSVVIRILNKMLKKYD
jgi:arylformamidase